MPSRNQGFVITYQAYNTSTGSYTTGDSANHTLRLIKDGTEAAPTNATAEVDSTNMPGFYAVALTSAETNFNAVTIGGKSSTANVILIPLTVGFENLPVPLTNTSQAQFGVNLVTWEGAVPAPLVNALVQAQVSGVANANTTQWNNTPVSGSLPPDAIFTPGQAAVQLQSGSSTTTVTLVSGSSNITDFYKNQIITLKSGLGTGESATIVNYNAATKVATINGTWAQAPSGGDAYFLIGQGIPSAISALSNNSVNVAQWQGNNVASVEVTGVPLVDVGYWRATVPNVLVSNRVDASVGALAAGVILNTSFGAGALTTAVFASNYLTGALIDPTGGQTIADDLLDRANAIETGITPRQAWRYVAAAEAGVTAGALTTTFTVAAIANNGTNRITATTTASGNRTAITLN